MIFFTQRKRKNYYRIFTVYVKGFFIKSGINLMPLSSIPILFRNKIWWPPPRGPSGKEDVLFIYD